MAKKRTTKRPVKPLEVPQGLDREATSSIELSRDAKGAPRWSIKLYGERSEMASVLEEVLALDQTLQERTLENGEATD